MTREPIYAALFAKLYTLKTNNSVVTCSRRLMHFTDLQAEQMPAIYMAQAGETLQRESVSLPTKWDLNVKIYVYVQVPEDQSPGPAINPIIDAIESLITPSPGYVQTLGGLCKQCFIDGAIETYEGTLGSLEVAVLPIKIIVR